MLTGQALPPARASGREGSMGSCVSRSRRRGGGCSRRSGALSFQGHPEMKTSRLPFGLMRKFLNYIAGMVVQH